jgi:sarcosine oxidase subunit gamma
MSELSSALPGAVAEGMVSVRELGLQGMVSLKADLGAAVEALRSVTGAAMPETRRVTDGQGVRVAWMAPDEVLILCDHARAEELCRQLGAALGPTHHLAVNVSDARAMFALAGPEAALRDTLAKVTPADMGALAPGEMRRTRLQQVPAAIWFESETEARVICFRSVARYVFDLLALSARSGGEVGYH